MREDIIRDLSEALAALGAPAEAGGETDLAIDKEFLDARWSTGEKKIQYESSIFVNDQDQTVYMYEKTTETGKGLSLGGISDSSFQSGTTLHRKVKSLQYGPEGRAYEMEIDLGAIPKAVKQISEKYGYRFKTVISRKKALYPAGYAMTAAAGTPPVMQAPLTMEKEKEEEGRPVPLHTPGKIPPKGILIELGILAFLSSSFTCFWK